MQTCRQRLVQTTAASNDAVRRRPQPDRRGRRQQLQQLQTRRPSRPTNHPSELSPATSLGHGLRYNLATIEASKVFGSSTIVIAIETIKSEQGEYLAYTDNGREYTGVNVIDWAQKVQELGAGEILLTSIDKEGTGDGFDNEIIREVSSVVDIPVIAHGGAGKIDHISDVLTTSSPDLETDTKLPSPFATVFTLTCLIVPSDLTSILLTAAAREAAPPI